VADEPRPLRPCDVCGQIDEHPRHVFVTAPGEYEPAADMIDQVRAHLRDGDYQGLVAADILAMATDATTAYRHMDCCRARGCPDGACDQVPADAKGPELVRAIQKAAG
jgi:hypothetical protein